MLRSAKDLDNYRIQAIDGPIGRVHDLLFHQPDWVVRYLVADTGSWLPGRRVLLPPRVIDRADWRDWALHVRLTRDQVEASPDVGTAIDRRLEADYHAHFGWNPYWVSLGLTGLPPGADLAVAEEAATRRADEAEADPSADPELRSARDVRHYAIRARDGDIGHVDDFVVDDDAWVIRHLVLDTRKWLRGRRILVDIRWVQDVDWLNRELRLDLSMQEIEASPEFDPEAPVNREYEVRMYDYYGRPHYWDE